MNDAHNFSNKILKGWRVENLYDFIDVIPTGVKLYKGEKDYISTGSIQENQVVPEGSFKYENKPSRANRIAHIGDVFQARMKSTNKAILIDEILDGVLFSTGFLQLSPKNNYNNKLLYYFIKSPVFLNQRDNYATGSTQEALTDDGLKKILIPVPSIKEQKAMVEKLDFLIPKIKKNIEKILKIKKNIHLLKQIVLSAAISGKLTASWRQRNSHISSPISLFNNERIKKYNIKSYGISKWVTLELEAVVDKIVDCPHSTPKWTSTGKICIRTTNFNPFYLDLSEVKYVSDDTFKARNSRLTPQEGDVLYSREGGILGIACQIASSLNICLGQRMMLIRGNSNLVRNEYITLMLNSEYIKSRVRDLIIGSAAPHINVGDVKKFEILLPPLEEQVEILRKVGLCISLVTKIEGQIEKAEAHISKLTQAVLAKTFKTE